MALGMWGGLAGLPSELHLYVGTGIEGYACFAFQFIPMSPLLMDRASHAVAHGGLLLSIMEYP